MPTPSWPRERDRQACGPVRGLSRVVAGVILVIIWTGGCMHHSEAEGVAADSLRYHEGMVIPSGILSPRPPLDSFLVGWYSRQLTALRETRLPVSCAASDEVYRFLWLRSFHHPVAIRVYSLSTGRSVVTSEADGAGGYEPGSLVRRDSATLSARDWHGLVEAIDEAELWSRPATDSTVSGLDGAEWIIEGCRHGRYQLVQRWSPKDTGASAFMRTLGVSLLRLGHLDIPTSELY